MFKNSPKANKALGQHFLKNTSVIKEICHQQNTIAESDYILEVGPGPGTLTRFLSELSKPFYIVEKDTRFQEELEKIVPPSNCFFMDALEFSDQMITDSNPHYTRGWLVSNLPYNVSTPLLLLFLNWPSIKFMTLMFQKEVGEKIINHQKINSLYCLVNTYFETKQLLKLKPGAFHPPPKVDSIVINFSRRENPLVNFSELKSYETLLRTIFSAKRKQVLSHLKGHQKIEKIKNFFTNKGIDEKIRAEKLTLQQIIELYLWLQRE